MDTDQVARAMLDMYKTEDDWCPAGLCMRKNGKDVYCPLAARVVIQYGDLSFWCTDTILAGFAEDEYLLKLAAVIREQYPELRSETGSHWDDLHLIYVFNDRHAQFADIRKILEKAAAG